jgi:DNA mismatch repair protein MLH1
VPPLNALPKFICGLVDCVNWESEQACFDGLARQVAALYRLDHVGVAVGTVHSTLHENTTVWVDSVRPAAGVERTKYSLAEQWTIQHLILPSMGKSYEPPKAHIANGAVVQVASTERLYKVFERC